jgi:hypothetical protein
VTPEPGPHRQVETAQRDQALQSASERSPRSTNRPCDCTTGWAQELAKWRCCLTFPRILPNRICIAHASFSMAC